MRNRVATATFQGLNGSLGFQSDKNYEILIRHQGGENIIVESGSLRCEYQSVISFLDNWNNIKVLEIYKFGHNIIEPELW